MEPGSPKTIKNKLVETFSKKSNSPKFLKEKSSSLEKTTISTEGDMKMKKQLRRGRSRSLINLDEMSREKQSKS